MAGFEPKPGTPLGRRFTHVYRSRGEPAADSPKMRRRLAVKLTDFGNMFEKFAERELGIPTPYSTIESWADLLGRWPLAEVLDMPTVAVRWVKDSRQGNRSDVVAYVVREINRIFEEENVAYRVDAAGGVHYLHDAEFEHNAQATLAGLRSAKYANVRDRFENGMAAISAAVPDGKTAIRNVFEAAEGLFRIMFSSAPRLAGDQVAKLEPLLQKKYAGDRTALSAASKLLASLKDWIEACHFYRHEAGKPDEVHQPPLELAVHLVSVGAAFIRLLIELDGHA